MTVQCFALPVSMRELRIYKFCIICKKERNVKVIDELGMCSFCVSNTRPEYETI